MEHHYRTGRIFKLTDIDDEVTYHIDCENGYSSWRFSSPLVSVKITESEVGIPKWYHIEALTSSGNTYHVNDYSPEIRNLIHEDYIKINLIKEHSILTLDEAIKLKITK